MKSLDKLVGEALTLAMLFFNATGHAPQPVDTAHATNTLIKQGESTVVVTTGALPLSHVVLSDKRQVTVMQRFGPPPPANEDTLLVGRVPFSEARLRISLMRDATVPR